MVGLNKYSEKMKRVMRRRNRVARDLRSPKFRQQVIEDKRRKKFDIDFDPDESV